MGVQEFLVVRCFSCSAFQVQQQKKSLKWSCTLCHAKQSLQRVYARSNKAADCRAVVQSYNSARGAAEAEVEAAEDDWDGEGEAAYYGEEAGWQDEVPGGAGRENKWGGFAEVRWVPGRTREFLVHRFLPSLG